MNHMTHGIENVIIIGGGPAGLAAAIYTARANLHPLVFAGSPPGGQLTLTTEVENYPGFESILGPELVEKMRKHALKFDSRIVDENVVKVDFSEKPYKTYTTNKTYRSHTILIATGAKALWLGLESETRLRGKGVSACATCDGFFFRNKTVGVVGGGDTAMEEALTLTKFASKVYIIHRRDTFRASKIMQERVLNHPKIEVIWNTRVIEVMGTNRVESVKLIDSIDSVRGSPPASALQTPMRAVVSPSSSATYRILQIDGLFIAIGNKPDTDLFKGYVELDKKGYVVTRLHSGYPSMTSVEGIFAAGDCVDHQYRQAATAVGMGVAAALDVERYLERGED